MTSATEELKRTDGARARVLYDGQCPLCRKSVQILRSVDWLHRLEYVDVRDPSQPILQHPLVVDAPLLEQMHVLPSHGRTIHGGFAAFRWMAWRLPLFWLCAPFLYLPGVPWLGDRIYKWIARNRFRLVPCHDGACTIQHADKRRQAL